MPIDIHLMVETPSNFFDKLINLRPDCIIYHIESPDNIGNLLLATKKSNIKSGIALNHDTPIDNVTEELMNIADKILIMSVITGFSGQPFIDFTYEKVENLKKQANNLGFEHLTIEVDGGLDENNIPRLYKCGATSYVLGTKGLFTQRENYFDRIKTIKNCIETKTKN